MNPISSSLGCHSYWFQLNTLACFLSAQTFTLLLARQGFFLSVIYFVTSAFTWFCHILQWHWSFLSIQWCSFTSFSLTGFQSRSLAAASNGMILGTRVDDMQFFSFPCSLLCRLQWMSLHYRSTTAADSLGHCSLLAVCSCYHAEVQLCCSAQTHC